MEFPVFLGNQPQTFGNSGPAHWTQECRKRVEAFESAQQKARQWETYFSNFVYYQQQQPANQNQIEEFKRYLNDYKTCWTSCHTVDPRAMVAMFREMECSLMQAKDELVVSLTQWKNDQALAQIGKPSNAHELQPIAIKFGKLDNTLCDAIGLIKRFQRFVEERLQHSQLTEMGQFWQETRQECIHISSRMAEFRHELQRESFLPFEQPPYIVRRFAGKIKSTGQGEDAGSGGGSGDEDGDQGFEDGQLEIKIPKHQGNAKLHVPGDATSNSVEHRRTRNTSAAKENKREHKVVFDLRVRLMVGDKSQIGDCTKVHAVLLTDQQCRELLSRNLSAYDDPLATLSEIGPPLTAASAGKTATKRKIAAARRRTPCLPGIPPFAAGQLTPHDAALTYDSSLEHFEAFFQNMKVNEKDRNPEADAQARFYRILFVTKLLDWQGKHFYVWCLSVPFPIVVNATRQERATSAKIFCRLALSAISEPLPQQPSRMQSPMSCASAPSYCPSVASTMSEHRLMTWTDFFDRLNWWWLKQTGAETSLHAHELYLAWKLGVNLGNPESACVSLEQVTKKYDGMDFSFWDWLFLIADFVKKNRGYWDSRFILGFVSKEQINSYLARSKEPVMFIRFSDSVLGSIVISYGQSGKEPQHIILHQKAELKQHRLTFFIQQSKQLLSVNYISTTLNPVNGLKPKFEFFKLDDIAVSPLDDDEEAMSKRGYTKPRLAFDWSEPPPNFSYEEHEDESPGSSVTLEDVLRTELVFDREFSSFGYDDLAADPNGFSTALTHRPTMAQSPATQAAHANNSWNGNYNSMNGSPSEMSYSSL